MTTTLASHHRNIHVEAMWREMHALSHSCHPFFTNQSVRRAFPRQLGVSPIDYWARFSVNDPVPAMELMATKGA